MLTEIYEVQEIDTEGRESDPLAMAIIDRMNLAHQLTETGRISFNVLTEEQAFVINNLFPTYCFIEDYKAGGLPLRILETYEKYHDDYSHWVVRYAPPAQIVDPILLATNAGDWAARGDISSKEVFLIGRWGDALEPWGSLYKKAYDIWGKKMSKALAKVKANIEKDIALIKEGHAPDRQAIPNYYPIFD